MSIHKNYVQLPSIFHPPIPVNLRIMNENRCKSYCSFTSIILANTSLLVGRNPCFNLSFQMRSTLWLKMNYLLGQIIFICPNILNSILIMVIIINDNGGNNKILLQLLFEE